MITKKLSWRLGGALAGLLLWGAPGHAQAPPPPPAMDGAKPAVPATPSGAQGAAPAEAKTPVIRIVGISRLADTGDLSWWGLDGKKVKIADTEGSAFTDARLTTATFPMTPDQRGVRILFEAKNLAPAQKCEARLTDGKTPLSFAWTSVARPNGVRLYAALAIFPQTLKTCAVHFGVTDADWRDIAQTKGAPSATASEAISGEIPQDDGSSAPISVLFSPLSQFSAASDSASDGPGLTATLQKPSQETRFVAVDALGKILPAQEIPGAADWNGAAQRTLIFSGLTAADIKAVKLQVRPTRWQLFSDVPLQAGS